MADAGEVPYWVAILTGLGGASLTGIGAVIVARVTGKGTTEAAETAAKASVQVTYVTVEAARDAAREAAERAREEAMVQRDHELILEGLRLASESHDPVARRQWRRILADLSVTDGLSPVQAKLLGSLASLIAPTQIDEGRAALTAGEEPAFLIYEGASQDDHDEEEV